MSVGIEGAGVGAGVGRRVGDAVGWRKDVNRERRKVNNVNATVPYLSVGK